METVATVLAALLGIGTLIAIGAAFLLAGDRLSKTEASEQSRSFLTLHLIAVAAAIVGGVLSWMAFDSDHPSKWLHLTLPIIFVAIVYGYSLGLRPAAWVAMLRDVRDRIWR